MIGTLLRHFPVAGERRGPLTRSEFAGAQPITITSDMFRDGTGLPGTCGGKGVGDNQSPQLSWTGVPPGTRQLVLVIDDVDVPLPRPIVHTIAVIEPTIAEVDTGALQPGTAGMRFIRGDLPHRGYAGPRPIPGHGPHRYRFQLFALGVPVPEDVRKTKALLELMAGHVLARGKLTGTYQRP